MCKLVWRCPLGLVLRLVQRRGSLLSSGRARESGEKCNAHSVWVSLVRPSRAVLQQRRVAGLLSADAAAPAHDSQYGRWRQHKYGTRRQEAGEAARADRPEPRSGGGGDTPRVACSVCIGAGRVQTRISVRVLMARDAAPAERTPGAATCRGAGPRVPIAIR